MLLLGKPAHLVAACHALLAHHWTAHGLLAHGLLAHHRPLLLPHKTRGATWESHVGLLIHELLLLLMLLMLLMLLPLLLLLLVVMLL